MTRSVPATLLALATLILATAQAGGAGTPTGMVALPQGCREGYARPDFTALNRELVAARARWRAAAPGSYRYDLHQIAAPVLFPDTRVTVVNGRVTSTERLPGQEGAPNPLARRTVDARFSDISRTLAAQRTGRCPEVQVTYDPKLGYPTRLYSGLGDAGIMDGFGEWTVTNFTPTR